MIVFKASGVDGKYVLEVFCRVDVQALTTDEDRVKDGGAFPGLWMSNEQPVLFANGGRAYGILHGVVVDGNLVVV